MKRKIALVDVPTLMDAAAAMTKLKESSLPDELQAEVAKTIADKMSAPDVSTSSRESLKSQKHQYFQHYMIAAEWDIISNPTVSLQNKVDIVVDRMKAIGLWSMAEKTAPFGD